MPKTTKFKVYNYYSGPYHNPYIATCKTLAAAQKAVAKNSQGCNPEFPHNLIWESPYKAREFVYNKKYKSGTCLSVYEIEVCW